MCILKLSDVVMSYSSKYNNLDVLKNINLTINHKDIISISGASGAGKTTLLNVMAGLQRPTSGFVEFEGENLYSKTDSQLSETRIRKFGFIFQAFHLIPSLTIHDNIVLPALYAKGFVNKPYYEEVVTTLGISNRLAFYPEMLSGGEKQRAAIARAIINEPQIIFADEPTGNLDSKNSNIVFDLLFKLRQINNSTLVFVSHEECLAAKAHRRIIMKDGVCFE